MREWTTGLGVLSRRTVAQGLLSEVGPSDHAPFERQVGRRWEAERTLWKGKSSGRDAPAGAERRVHGEAREIKAEGRRMRAAGNHLCLPTSSNSGLHFLEPGSHSKRSNR